MIQMPFPTVSFLVAFPQFSGHRVGVKGGGIHKKQTFIFPFLVVVETVGFKARLRLPP